MPKDWNPQEIQQALDLEMHGEVVGDGEVITPTTEDIAKRKARDSVAFAMSRIIHIACYSENESRALAASTFIVEKVLGKTTDIPISATSEQDRLTSIVGAAYGHGED